jgi:threonine dehydrogenase-like Zn-dependent dehydrogenase
VSLVMDGAPVIGERVVVFGQGIVGLLTTALLANFPLENLVSIDHYNLRRQASLDLGAKRSVDPADSELFESISQEHGVQGAHRADLVYELTGNPEVLNHAIQAVDYEGRIVLGSWYGNKRANIDLGGWFHRGRIKIISSQVSRIGSLFSNRWDKGRRFQLAWKMLNQIIPSKLITHEFPIQDAAKAFRLLDENPGEVLQVVFRY